MTDEKPKPERFQPKSKSPFADADSAPIATEAPKKNMPARPKPKAPAAPPAKKVAIEAEGRERMLNENQLETLQLAAETEAEQTPEQTPGVGHNSRIATGDRVPFGNQTAKMAVPDREGFTRRWFNDKPGRIQRALRAGYKLIEDETGKPISLIVNQSANANDAMKAFCMEIPNEFYDEDFALKQEALDFTDQQIYAGRNNEQPGDKRYVPADTMKFSTKRGPGSHIA